ncbi:methionyl-tRNA formyltransferase [Weissella hellenica]|uniref:Methionyl-tRNA formyltransferase n=1 Tax=Weissella hellenica TaxID=46256 RepID=A0A4Y4G2V5_WEIHE|nr:methionyl-tRNA formyltransferase [Weissella hellenica]NKY67029.1 methionyl-tRNA formyltransferase [Weissella hellenica]GED36043.1 methionyl-tRNA formyltransferase [Weissella hellenica]SCB96419.1 methionyl-tRNA formyltransferase [Weissella hellenica]
MTSIVFMGTPNFSAPILQTLVDNPNYDVQAVLTQPDRPVGRKHVLTPTPVKEVAVKAGIPVLQPNKLSGSNEMQQIIDLEPDLIITAAYGQFLPTKLLEAAQIAAINVHASLLPKYRGGAPIHYAVLNGDDKTGVTIMYMVKAMDAGDIIAQKELPILATDNTGILFDKLSILGCDLLLETLPDLIAGKIKAIAQNPDEVTFSPNIKPEEEILDFTKSAQTIHNHVRGLNPFPIAHTTINGVRTKIQQTHLIDETTTALPGTVVKKGKHELWLATGDSKIIAIDELQPAGKPKMTITAYLNGHAKFAQGDQVITHE